jgi:hypothetical protein
MVGFAFEWHSRSSCNGRSLTSSSVRSESFERLAVALHTSPWAAFEKLSGERAMDVDYVFLCGVMWCCYGQEDAGQELLRATDSADPDLSALASAMLRQRRYSLRQDRA